MDLCLRRATPSDAPGVARVYVESWNDGLAQLMRPRVLDGAQVARWARDLDDDTVRWQVVVEHALVVGLVGTGRSRDPVDVGLGELDTIAVAPSSQRRGVGRRLMGAAVQDLGDAGYRHAIVWTLAHHPAGHAFYEATGWHSSGEARDGDRQVAFRRALAR